MSFQKISRSVIVTAFVSLLSCNAAFAAVTGKVNGTNVNVRGDANATSNIVGTLNTGATVNVLGKAGDWYEISYDGIQSAFISSEFLKVADGSDSEPEAKTAEAAPAAEATQAAAAPPAQNTYAIVTSDNGLKLREAASTESNAIMVLSFNEVVDVVEPGSQWIKVKTENGNTGYVSSEFVSIRTGEKPSRGNSSKGEQVVAYAKQFIGTPYVWGGTNLNSGVDCSGFVYAVMNNFGVKLNRSSASMASNGVAVAKSELIPGDLVLFDTTGPNDGGISHVGIYVGDGKYIHSSSGKAWGVVISDLYDAYGLRTYVTARRVLR